MNNSNSGSKKGKKKVERMNSPLVNQTFFTTIFELEKKYSRSLQQKELIEIDEAESDRTTSSDAYEYLNGQRENLVDAKLYADYVDMHKLREKVEVEASLLPIQKLRLFGSKIHQYCQPVIFTQSQTFFPDFSDLVKKQQPEILEYSDKNLEEKIKEQIENNFIPIDSSFIDISDIMSIEKKLYERLVDKKIPKVELEQNLTTLEAEILSKLISEKRINVTLEEKDILAFSSTTKKERNISSSVLLSPSKNTKAENKEMIDDG